VARTVLLALPVLLALFAAGCAGSPNMLDPHGPRAARIAEMWWVMFALALVIFVIFTALFFYPIIRFREGRPPEEPRQINGIVLVAVLGFFIPLYTNRLMNVLAAPERPSELNIEVIGFQFWWEVRYPDHGIITANEIHIPAGVPVTVTLTSRDVIHSLWTPQIHDKQDLTPGTSKTLWIQADTPGEYRGICAEFCGLQHSKMQYLLIVQPRPEFDAWLAERQQPPPPPATAQIEQGRQVFLNQLCISCHAVRDLPGDARVGPDLTHLASRRTLAAAWIENSRENLIAFIRDPHEFKPGLNMPPFPLAVEEMEALIAYLETLR
jgi:cytochrome c oxidase subunit II